MKKNSILFIFILLLCIGLQYETIYYTDGSMSGAEYGLMGVSIFLALFYMIPALYFLFRIGKKWELPKNALILSLLGGMFLSGWLSSFANTYIHDLLEFLFPDSAFLNAFESAIVAPLVEEPLKLLPLVFVLALIPVRKLKSLFLLGIASGLGFQMIEDIGYIRTDLPEGFQRSEFLLEHGLIDAIVPRAEMRQYLSDIINVLSKNAVQIDDTSDKSLHEEGSEE